MHQTTTKLFAILVGIFISAAPLSAQINTYLKSVSPTSVVEQTPLRVSVRLDLSSDLERVTMFYRQFGETEYRSQEMELLRDSAVSEISASEVRVPFMELYIVAQTTTGVTETLPLENPTVSPMRITVTPAPLQPEVIILSPEQGQPVKEGELYISVSFVYADKATDVAKTHIRLNGVDITDRAVFYGDLLIVPPEAITPDMASGASRIAVQTFDTTGQERTLVRRRFSVVTPQQAEELKSDFAGFGNAQVELRDENVKGTHKTYKRLDARASGSYQNWLKSNAVLTLTSEEKPENQPQNRYFLGLDARYAQVGFGDAYPRFPNTIMDGRRIRGFTGDLLLGAFNVDVATGEILRRVENNSVPQTLKRNMTIIRPSFGKGENFQWGFTYMKAKDEFDPAQPIVVRPQENAVFGSDMIIAVDHHRIVFSGQTALSLNNVDISTPEFTKDSIDAAVARGTFSQSDGDQLKKYLPILTQIIHVNENLVPIDPTGQTSLVYETGVAFNYFGNYLKGTYKYHGKDYNSTGATTIRRDIKGYNISDRLRLLQNRFFISGSYEVLENNTSGYEIATTTYKTMNASVSYFPAGGLPNVTIGYGKNINSNPISTSALSDSTASDIEKQIALRAIDDQTNRYYIQSSYDFAYLGQHNLSFNMDISDKDDRTPKEQDVKSFNTLLLVSTVHNPRLESSVGISLSNLTFPQVETDSLGNTIISSATVGYQTLTLAGRYKLYKDVLRATGTIAPTFGDFARFLIEAGLIYTITERQSATLRYQFIKNSSSALATLTSKNDSYISLLYRIDF